MKKETKKSVLRTELQTKCEAKKMYNFATPRGTAIKGITPKVGESMIRKMQRILESGEPIKERDKVQPVYQSRAEGVNPLTNIRADRWEIATEGTHKNAQDILTKRAERNQPKPSTDSPTIDQPVP